MTAHQDGSRSSGRAPSRSESEQRAWRELITSLVTSPITGNQREIFTNRTLRFDRIAAVGFDLDHTLAVYDSATLDSVAMRMVIDRLIRDEGYAASLFDQIPDPSFARKGLTIDVELGNVLKVDRHGHVLRAYHGTERLSSSERRRQYGGIDVIPHVTQARRFLQSDTAFAHPELLIWAALTPHVPKENCNRLWQQIRHHTDAIHRDGSLKAIITADVLEFIRPDYDTVAMLEKLRRSGKKVFLLTNSEWEYTRRIVGPAFGLDLSDGNDDWIDLFDLVVVESKKPRYFHPEEAAPAEEIRVGDRVVLRGGHIGDLEQRLGVRGPEVLYVGDHIYGDLIKSKRTQHWRTMLVIPELEDELRVQMALPGAAEQMRNSDARRSHAERLVQHWLAIEEALSRLPTVEDPQMLEQFRNDCARNRKQAQHALRSHISQREELNRRLGEATNEYWGSLFRADSELTYYGKQLEDFADTYTGRATNLGLTTSDHYFRSTLDYLPHELGPF